MSSKTSFSVEHIFTVALPFTRPFSLNGTTLTPFGTETGSTMRFDPPLSVTS